MWFVVCFLHANLSLFYDLSMIIVVLLPLICHLLLTLHLNYMKIE